ncbi:hypothetical protein WA026_001322 [Henosepilachna vigintioctopunctata]|uniref:THAP-type domain-containing protein n=1 Tax=Henosepilachna vigintioctopunctata TaxID=420089 RepID=A0AAW1UT21_9CUCU
MMGGCRCSYKNCSNTTKTTSKIHFFHYPVKQRERCKTWIQRAEKPHFFDLDEYQLRNKVICEVHFQDDCFLNSQKKRLYPNAIPSLEGDAYCDIEEKSPVPLLELNTPKERGYQDRFKQFANKIDDIKILPASDDGTSFILDTYPTYKNFKYVKSYVLSNDVLLPIDEKRNSNSLVKTERIEEVEEDYNSFILNDDGCTTISQKVKPPKNLPEQQLLTIKYEKPALKNSSFDSGTHSMKSRNETNSNNITEEKLEQMICKTVETKYLHKLEQHTKDLNQIKKSLRISKNVKRLNRSSVLRFLKLRLPPSLFTLVNLSLDDDYNLTEEDETFFKNLHESSPVAYQFLMEDCTWRMPIIELHEDDAESMDDT